MQSSFDFSAYEKFHHRRPFDFSKNSSVGCGGFADIVFSPRDVPELIALKGKLKKEKIPHCVLGNLTNVLPSDEGFCGAIISMKQLTGVACGEEIFVYAGTGSGELLSVAKRERKSGLEFLKGVPCTLGGALYMNAGAGEKYISEQVKSVLLLQNGKVRALSVEKCGYSYKKSVFMETDDIILGATLRVKNATREEIDGKEDWFAQRRAHLPKGRSMGCVFKNPTGKYAGELIEGSGLKGFRIGGAKISEEHANFIINDRNGTAKDIKALIALIKNAVRSQYGVTLEEEIRYL